MNHNPHFIVALLAGVLSTTQPVSATTRIWQNAVNGDFSDATKWGGNVPGTGDVASFTGNPAYSGGSSFTVTLTGNVTNQYMRVDGEGPFTMTLNLAGYNYTATDYTAATTGTVVGRGGNDNNTLNIQGGGTFGSNGFSIAANPTATGKVTVSGTGTALSVKTNEAVIGYTGAGTLEVTDKAAFTTSGAIARIGRGSGSVGTVLIDDATWTANHELQLGSFNANSTGNLTVRNGGKVSVTSAGQNGWLSFGAVGTAAALITGAGSEVSANSVIGIGGRGTTAGGNASVTVEDGGKLTTTGALNLFANGTLSVEDGLVSASSLGSSSVLASGDISLTLSGLDTLIDISGDVYLDAAQSSLVLSLQTGASYGVNDVIRLINYGGSLTGTFSNFTEGQTFQLGGYDFQMSYSMTSGADSFIGLTVVPEPSTAALLGAAALAALVGIKFIRRITRPLSE